MSHSLRWSCCAAAFASLAALVTSNSALGQYANHAYASNQPGGWTPTDYSAAYAPYAASYNYNAGRGHGGCTSGSRGAGCECGASCGCGDACGCGDSCGSGSCGAGCGCSPDNGCGTYGGCGNGNYGYGAYSGDCGCSGYGDYGCSGYGGECGCDPYTMGCDDMGCQPYYDNGVKCGIDPCAEQRCRVPKVSVFGDYLYLQVSDVDVAHAQQQNGIGGAGTVPFGDIGTIGQDWEKHNYRVGGSIACGPCSDVVAMYTSFETDSRDQVLAPVIPGGGGAVGSLVHHPGAALTASAGPVDASYSIDMKLGEILCRSVWHQGPRHQLRWMVGGQYGHLEQDFSQTGIFGGGLGGTVDTSTSINFDGGGLKAGLDAERRFKHGLLVYGRATASAMTGRFNSRYEMFNSTTQSVLAQANWKDDRAISQLEYEFGVGITSIDCHWRTTIGYMLSYWDNVVTTGDFIDAVQADNYTNVGDSMTFDGFVTRAEFRW